LIRDVKFLPHQSEITHEFEINPTDILFNSYDITEKNKLQHFSKARNMHDFIQKHVNIRKVDEIHYFHIREECAGNGFFLRLCECSTCNDAIKC